MVASTNSDSNKHRFVVGVDFGTTFTSVAWAHYSFPDEIKLVQTWPNGSTGNGSADQVPTELHYSNTRTRERTWGYEIPKFNKDIEPLKWFKLLLQENPKPAMISHPGDLLLGLKNMTLSPESSVRENSSNSSNSSCYIPPTVTPAQKTKLQLRTLKMQPIQVIADFLSNVRKVSVDSIERAYERDWTETKIFYVLTVPAIWTDPAKNLMVQAAENAGFGTHRVDFSLVSEPEAAAAYALKAIQPNSLYRGDTFIICDAGGGTVDLISYKITDLSPLRIDEVVSGTGDLCGSVFLDSYFEEYIRGVLGNSVVDAMKPRSLHEMFRTWEEKVKFRFGNNTNLEGCEVNVPGIRDNPKKNIEDCFHTMAQDDVKKIFDPIVNHIVMLVKSQVHAVQRKGMNVKAIILVGGFGSSEYLRKRLEEARYGGRELQVLQPINARSAIARGALLRGLDGSIVVERRARLYYGNLANTSPSDDDPSDVEEHTFWCDKQEEFRVRDKLNWHISKNQIVGSTVSTSLSFYRLVPTSSPNFVFSTPLRVCDLDDAPNYLWKDPAAVRTLCTLRSDLTGIPVSKYQVTRNSNGQSYYRVDYQLVMKVQDEVLMFELLFQGVRCGSVSADFE